MAEESLVDFGFEQKMSICVIAKFPWKAIRESGIVTKPFCLMFSDTRVTKLEAGEAESMPHKLAKQRQLSKNLIVCYTSTDIFATTEAIDKVEANMSDAAKEWSPISIKDKIKKSLKFTHMEKGGATQLLAVIWDRKSKMPILFSFTPGNHYEPKHQIGVIGIGPEDVITKFQSIAENPPRAVGALFRDIAITKECGFPGISKEDKIKSLKGSLFYSVLAEYAGNFTRAIKESGIEVGLPIQACFMDETGIHGVPLFIGPAVGTPNFEKITAETSELTIPSNKARRGRKSTLPYPPKRIFD